MGSLIKKMSEQDSAVDMDPEEGRLRSIDSTSFDGTSRPTSSGERESRASNFSMSDDISINQIPESLPSPSPGSAMSQSTAPKSNYLLRLKKQTNKHSRSDTNDLVDSMNTMNSLKQRNQKMVQMERSNSPLLGMQSDESPIEVKKCESACGSKYILKGTRSTMSITSQSGQSECSNQSHVNNKQQTNSKPTNREKIIEESEDESDLTPSEILIR